MKKLLSVFLSVLMFVSALPLAGVTASAADYENVQTKVSSLKTGDLFKYGSYPQSRVTDSALLNKLKQVKCTDLTSTYVQNANADTLKSKDVDITYADFTYGNNKYRKVTINEYRPYFTDTASSEENSYQDDNGYVKGVYYFKWEPIEWIVLENSADGVLALSKDILDSQPYYNYYSSVTWEGSYLRKILNSDFYYSAFDFSQRRKIKSETLKTQGYPAGDTDGGKDTSDKIRLLSYEDVNNKKYGFKVNNDGISNERIAKGTDYAKSQGLYVSDNSEYTGNSIWWLRSPSDGGYNALRVDDDGYADSYYGMSVYATQIGVRPAFKLSADTDVEVLREIVKTEEKRSENQNENKNSNPEKNKKVSVKSTKITKLKREKKSFTVYWKKAKDVSGYQIRYSTNKNMKKSKKKNVKGAKKTKLKISKLKKNKKYYVQIRSYKKVGNKTYYSKWSAKKSVKTK